MSAESEEAAGRLADHLKNCRNVDAVIAGDGNLDDVVSTMLAVRYLVPPVTDLAERS